LISGFDHIVIAVQDIGASARAYETLLGRTISRTEPRDGMEAALIDVGNISVELLAPRGDGDMVTRLRTALADGEGLKSIAFASDDIERAHRRAERVGLAPESIRVARDGGRVFRLDGARARGLRVFVTEQQREAPSQSPSATVLGVDHIVVRSGDGEAALALFGARLGLSLRLETHVAGRRLMMLRCGDAIVEIAEDRSIERDGLWGVSWRVANADAEHARLRAAGLNVSEVRAGVKPNTRVFTVRDGTCGVPTLMIEHIR
jgi:catechol 2,3-dioxygenase-like lactoylglutathione lyase family enzyme